MEDLKIPNTAKTPGIDFNSVTGDFFVSGISVPENPKGFYTTVIEWLKEYVKIPAENTKMVFELSYVNTSSLQYFYDLLMLLDGVNGKKTTVNIEWHYLEDDVDMQEMGQDFKDALSVDFSFIPIEDI